MKTHSLRLLLLCSTLAFALSGSGCRLLKKKGEATPSATAPVAVAVPTTPPAPATVAVPAAEPTVNVADEAVATTEDFEDEAFAKITDKSYKADFEALKKEIEEP